VRRDRNTDHGYTGFRYHTGTRTGSRNTTRAPRRDVTMPCTCYSMHCETKSTLLNHCYLSPAHHPSNCAIRPVIPRINKSHSAQPRFLRGPSFYDKFAPTPRSARHLPADAFRTRRKISIITRSICTYCKKLLYERGRHLDRHQHNCQNKTRPQLSITL
jgi:hypothetical protein